MQEKRKRGRPSEFKPEFLNQAYKLCLLGATDKEMADIFGVSESGFNKWKTLHPELVESLKDGKERADSRVVESLFHRAQGYKHAEDEIFQYQGEPLVVPTIKHYPPDTTACIFWLKNRQKEKWRDLTQQDLNVNLTGNVAEKLKNALDKSKTPDIVEK